MNKQFATAEAGYPGVPAVFDLADLLDCRTDPQPFQCRTRRTWAWAPARRQARTARADRRRGGLGDLYGIAANDRAEVVRDVCSPEVDHGGGGARGRGNSHGGSPSMKVRE